MHRHRPTGLKQSNKAHKGSSSTKRARSRGNHGKVEKSRNLQQRTLCDKRRRVAPEPRLTIAIPPV